MIIQRNTQTILEAEKLRSVLNCKLEDTTITGSVQTLNELFEKPDRRYIDYLPLVEQLYRMHCSLIVIENSDIAELYVEDLNAYKREHHIEMD